MRPNFISSHIPSLSNVSPSNCIQYVPRKQERTKTHCVRCNSALLEPSPLRAAIRTSGSVHAPTPTILMAQTVIGNPSSALPSSNHEASIQVIHDKGDSIAVSDALTTMASSPTSRDEVAALPLFQLESDRTSDCSNDGGVNPTTAVPEVQPVSIDVPFSSLPLISSNLPI